MPDVKWHLHGTRDCAFSFSNCTQAPPLPYLPLIPLNFSYLPLLDVHVLSRLRDALLLIRENTFVPFHSESDKCANVPVDESRCWCRSVKPAEYYLWHFRWCVIETIMSAEIFTTPSQPRIWKSEHLFHFDDSPHFSISDGHFHHLTWAQSIHHSLPRRWHHRIWQWHKSVKWNGIVLTDGMRLQW